MKRPDYDDYWEPPDYNDHWLYSAYWDICVLMHKGSKGFWNEVHLPQMHVLHPRGIVGCYLDKPAS